MPRGVEGPPPRHYTRWPEETRRRALECYQESGAAVAARLTGVGINTIRFWAREAGVQPPDDYRAQFAKYAEMGIAWTEAQVDAMRKDLRGKLIAMALRTVQRIDEPYEDHTPSGKIIEHEAPPANATRDFAIAAGILIDKFRLESGEASQIFGSVDVLPALDDHEKAALAQVLRDAIKEKATEATEVA
jgi:transposase-like protein